MASTKMVRIPIADLTVVRITCKHCNACFEVPIADVAKRFRSGDCPFCTETIFRGQERNKPIEQIAYVLSELAGDQKLSEVEFVVPAES
jgi:hypothetical protein